MATAVEDKTNERPGVRSQVRFARMSATKARAVLDLIRGKHVEEAGQILAFNERRAATVIDKCLKAAIANAEHNEEIDADELYVGACYADEGPTLKRFRPRARGRAGRIRKQTCHITVIVSRYSDDELDERRRREAERSTGGSRDADARAQRRRRVARSRATGSADSAEPADDTTTEPEATEAADTEAADTEAADTEVIEAEVVDTVSDDADDAAPKSKEAD